MAELNVAGANLGNALQDLLMADDLQPGDEPSYQICKNIYLYHPLGARMAESPISMAQSQQREISIPNSPEEFVRDAFLAEWEEIGADDLIHNVMRTSRIYGVASIAMLAEGVPTDRPIDPKKFWELDLSFNVLDPLNTAGSLVLSQNPNALDFQKQHGISVSGVPYHRSRTVTIMNEKPIYIAYSNSAFGYVGRSVYQRALFPLKSYINSLITDDMVTRKAGVMVAKLKPAGSIIDNIMANMAGLKRQLLKEAQTNNVISVSVDEDIETLNMQNIDGAFGQARRNILENISTAADMPAQLLTQDSLSAEFHEGTEDAKRIASYIDRIRVSMRPLYSYFDRIVQYRAWNPNFYKTVQARYPEEYGKKGYTQAFYEWTNSFKAEWPSLLIEPESERVKVEETKFKALLGAAEVFLPEMDPENKARVFQWMEDTFNEQKMLFPNPLVLDYDALRNYTPPQLDMSGLDKEPDRHEKFADSSKVARLPRKRT